MDEFSFLDDLQKKKEQAQPTQQPVQQPVNSLGQQVQGAIDNTAPQIDMSNPYMAALYQTPQQAQTQENNGYWENFKKGAAAQAAGAVGGQADFVSGVLGTDGAVGDYFQNVAKNNQRQTNYELKDVLANPLQYITDPSGLTYDVGGGFGSSGVLGAEGAAIMAALPASVTAGITGAIGAGAARMGLPWIANALKTPAGKMLLGNVLKTPVEAMSEGGNTYREMTRNEDGTVNQNADTEAARRAMYTDTALNSALLTFTNSLESAGLGSLINASGGKGRVLNILKGVVGDFLQNGYEEGAQAGISNYSQGKGTARQILDPTQWTPEQQNEAFIGGITGMVQGGGMTAGGMVANKILGNNQQPQQNVAEAQQNIVQPEQDNEQQGSSLVDKVRSLEGQIPYEAEDGTNCMRTMGIALAGTPYEGQINVDQAVATAQQYGQLMNPDDYTPQAGDLAVVEDGNHIVMVTENGGTIQNGASHNGVYEKDTTPAEMFGKVKYYIRTSDYNNGVGNYTPSQNTLATEPYSAPIDDYVDEYLNSLMQGDTLDTSTVAGLNPATQDFNEALQNSSQNVEAQDELASQIEATKQELDNAKQELLVAGRLAKASKNPALKQEATAKYNEIKARYENLQNALKNRYTNRYAPKQQTANKFNYQAPKQKAMPDFTEQYQNIIPNMADNELNDFVRRSANSPARTMAVEELRKRGLTTNNMNRAGELVPVGNNTPARTANMTTVEEEAPEQQYAGSNRGGMAVRNTDVANVGNRDVATRKNNAVGRARTDNTQRLTGAQALPEHVEEYAGSNVASNMVQRRREAMAERRNRIGNDKSPDDIITNYAGSRTRNNQYRAGNGIQDAEIVAAEEKARDAGVPARVIEATKKNPERVLQLASKSKVNINPATLQLAQAVSEVNNNENNKGQVNNNENAKPEQSKGEQGQASESTEDQTDQVSKDVVRPVVKKYVSQRLEEIQTATDNFKNGEYQYFYQYDNAIEKVKKKLDNRLRQGGLSTAERSELKKVSANINDSNKVVYDILDDKYGDGQEQTLPENQEEKIRSVVWDKKLGNAERKGTPVLAHHKGDTYEYTGVKYVFGDTNAFVWSNDADEISVSISKDKDFEWQASFKSKSAKKVKEYITALSKGEKLPTAKTKKKGNSLVSEGVLMPNGKAYEVEIVGDRIRFYFNPNLEGNESTFTERKKQNITFNSEELYYETPANDKWLEFAKNFNSEAVENYKKNNQTNQAEGSVEQAEKPTSNEKGKQEETIAPKKKASQNQKENTKTSNKIEDFGEKIGGAKKDTYRLFNDAINKDTGKDEYIALPLSKSLPAPDYQKMLDDGVDEKVVAFIRAQRDSIPRKPRRGVERWAELVQRTKDNIKGLLDWYNKDPKEVSKVYDNLLKEQIEKTQKTSWWNRSSFKAIGLAELYRTVGHDKSLADLDISYSHYTMKNGIEYPNGINLWVIEQKTKGSVFSNMPYELGVGKTFEEAVQDFKKKFEAGKDKEEKIKKGVNFELYSNREGYFVGKKIGRNVQRFSDYFPRTKDGLAEARKYKAENQAELEEKLKKFKTIPMERRDINNPRLGVDMRGGEDVTPELFTEAFGFRGVEFGNWVEGGRRQKDLNDAYDALMDMATLIGISPKAISLNGKLGLAFGARGSGGKNAPAAHYEPSFNVINITKMNGRGSLAHEWWHALDAYFDQKRNKRNSTASMLEATDVSLIARNAAESLIDHYLDNGNRREMANAYAGVLKAIRDSKLEKRSEALDETRSTPYWTQTLEMGARSYESYILAKLHDNNASNDYLVNITDVEQWAKANEKLGKETKWGDYPYPIAEEMPAIREAFDKFFQTIEQRNVVDENGKQQVELYSVKQEEAVERSVEEIVKEVVDAFPRAKISVDENGKLGVALPNGSNFVVDIRNNIILSEDSQEKADKAHGTTNGFVQGYWEIDTEANSRLLVISKKSERGTAYHEALHAAVDLALTKKEQKSLFNYYTGIAERQGKFNNDMEADEKAAIVEEIMADAYSEWKLARKNHKGDLFGKLWQKVKDLCTKLKALFDEGAKVQAIFQDIESNKVYERNNTNTLVDKISFSVAKDKLDNALQKTKRLVASALKDKQFQDNAELWKVDTEESDAIKKYVGLNVKGFRHTITADEIRHAYNEHKIEDVDHIPLTDTDIANMPNILAKPDWITRGTLSKDGHAVLRYHKKEKDGTFTVVELIYSGDKTLRFKTMWKDSVAPTNRANSTSNHTSKNESNTSPSTVDSSLAQGNKVVKYSVKQEAPKQRTVSRQELQAKAQAIVPLKVEKNQRDALHKMYNRKANLGFVHAAGSINEISGIIGMYVDNVSKLSEKDNLKQELLEGAWDRAQDMKQAQKFSALDEDLKVKEGAAYFGRLYATDKATAENKFPEYFKAYENYLNKHKELKAKTDDFYSTAEAFYKQTPEGRAKAGITQLDDPPKTRKEKVKAYLRDFYVNWFDDKDVLRRVERKIEALSGEKIANNDSAYIQARLAGSTTASRVDLVINGAVDQWGKTAAKGSKERNAWFKALNEVYDGAMLHDVCYQDIVDKATEVDKSYIEKHNFRDAMEALGTYLLANRFSEIWETKPNYKASMTKEQVRQVLKNAPKALKEAAQLYYDFNANMISVLHKEGMLSDAAYNGLKKYTRYCPLFRDFTDEASFDGFMNKLSDSNSYINLSNGIKALTEEGSDRTVLDDPTKSMLRMSAAIISKVERNKVAKKFVALSDRSGVGRFVIPALDPKTGEQLKTSNPQESRFTVWENGEKKAYTTLPEVYEVLEGGNAAATAYGDMLTNMVSHKAASYLRKGATASVGFIIRNFIRDTISGMMNSKNGFVPFRDSYRGMKLLLTDADFRAKYMASGANMSSYFKQDAEGLQDMLDEMAGNKWWQKASAAEKLKMMWDHYEQFGELIEQSTRAGEFALALKNGKSLLEAAYDAKEITLDFSRAGKTGREVNRKIAFFNAVLQGGDKMVRTALENPQRTMAVSAKLALATVLLWAINHDEDWYKELDRESKYSNWHFHVGDKHIVIPKPQEFGLLTCASAEAALESIYEQNPKAMKEWAKQFVVQMTPSLLPTLYQPIIEAWANYSIHFDSPIVSKKYQNLKEEAQINSNTSELAKGLGSLTGKSPIKIDYLIRGYFGGAGAFVARIPNKILEEGGQPAKYWNEMPVINEFVQNDFDHAKSINEWYELKDKLSKERATNLADGKGVKGKPPTYMSDVNKISTRLSAIRKRIEQVKASRLQMYLLPY